MVHVRNYVANLAEGSRLRETATFLTQTTIKEAVKNQHKGKAINPTEKDKNVVFFIVKNNIPLACPRGESKKRFPCSF